MRLGHESRACRLLEREERNPLRAAVITLHQVNNYGTQLQALATQEKLREYFDDVVFIDYRRPDTYGRGLLESFAKGSPLRAAAILPTLIRWKGVFDGFRERYLNLTDRVYLGQSDFECFEDCADVYVVGSDQVWNAGWNKGVIPAFYLDFAPEDKPRFAYASSFGRGRLEGSEIEATRGYIERFQMISVREESGVSILRKQYDYDRVSRILDPTLAMPPSFWRKYESPSRIEGEYILAYNLNRSAEFDRYASELARRTGLPLYRFCTRYDQVLRSGRSLVIPDVLDFVTLVDNARYVVTDSFHATAFSMNMGTEPICVYPKDYSGRISEFLRLVESEQRHVKSPQDYDVIYRPVDFERVGEILDRERLRADDFVARMRALA